MHTHRNVEVKKQGFGWLQVLIIVGLVVAVTMLGTAWWITQNIYAAPFQPTHLNIEEQKILDAKISKIQDTPVKTEQVPEIPVSDSGGPLVPEPYKEDPTKREITLTEKEVNALVAKNPDAAKRVAIDLADDLVTVKLLVPLDEDLPIMGGTTLRVKLGVTLQYQHGKPVVAMRGVTLGGVPLPQAWWGEIKNKNLVEEFGAAGGFWDQFSKGVNDLRVQEGKLWVKLKE